MRKNLVFVKDGTAQLKPKCGTVEGNTQYLDILPKILEQYNNSKHSSIKMTPVEASKKKK